MQQTKRLYEVSVQYDCSAPNIPEVISNVRVFSLEIDPSVSTDPVVDILQSVRTTLSQDLLYDPPTLRNFTLRVDLVP